jgi:Pyruvate/2-oxoacid:ferredoxin oxidoreductase delta subunit
MMGSATKKAFKCKSCGYCALWCPTKALHMVPWSDVTVARHPKL